MFPTRLLAYPRSDQKPYPRLPRPSSTVPLTDIWETPHSCYLGHDRILFHSRAGLLQTLQPAPVKIGFFSDNDQTDGSHKNKPDHDLVGQIQTAGRVQYEGHVVKGKSHHDRLYGHDPPIGGLVSVPVIAVPTSIGYGASFAGVAPLLTMLNSCASGVAVVNIDNGFAGGYIAALINRLAVQGPSTKNDEGTK